MGIVRLVAVKTFSVSVRSPRTKLFPLMVRIILHDHLWWVLTPQKHLVCSCSCCSSDHPCLAVAPALAIAHGFSNLVLITFWF